MDAIIKKKVEEFFSQYDQKNLKKGTTIIRAEEDPAGIYYIEEGTVKEYSLNSNGEESIVNIFKPSGFFPMSWAVNNTPNHYFYESLSPVIIRRAPKKLVIKFVKENPDVMYDLLSRVFRGVDGLLNRMTYLMSGSAYARIITELILYAKRFGKDFTNINIDLSEKELAALSGMTRETVSREMRTLKDKELVYTKDSNLVIKSLEDLEKELSQI